MLEWLSPEWWLERLLSRGWEYRKAKLFEHYMGLMLEQVAAVVPISILLVTVMGIFFGASVESPILIVFGLTMAIIGLAVFIDALRVVVMPLSEQLGTELPKTLPLPGVLAVTCFLGILVTYAEPAITSLRPLARLVDPEVAPYLYCALMVKQELLVFCIGLGVGGAAMLGTLRFVRGWSLKPMILITIVPCLMCACYMWWGDRELRPLLGLAWDCGTLATGVVSVPVLLALGIGVMKTQKEKRKAAEEEEARKNGGQRRESEAASNALEGFGMITLASLMPVLAVELLAIGLKWHYTHEDIIAMKPPPIDENALIEQSPYREIYFAVRAILPLNIALVALVVLVLRKPLPEFTYYLEGAQQKEQPKPTIERNRGGSFDDTLSHNNSVSEFDNSGHPVKSPPVGKRGPDDQDESGRDDVSDIVKEFVNEGRDGVRVPKGKRKTLTRQSSLDRVRKSSMELYRSIAKMGRRASAKGSLALYGDAISGVSAYTAAQAAASAPARPLNGRESFSRTRSAGSSGRGAKAAQTSFNRAKSSVAKMERDKVEDDLALIEAQFTGELRAEAAARPGSIDSRDRPEEEAACPSGPEGKDLNGVGTMGSSVCEIQPDLSAHGSQIDPGDGADSPKPSEASDRVSFRTMVDGRDVEMTEFADAGVILVVKSSAARKPGELADGAEAEEPADVAKTHEPVTRSSRKAIVILISGVCQAQFGMIMFNLGLNFGFTSLGDQVGTLLPAAFIDTKNEPAAPYYSFNTGVAIALGTMFTLGVLAARAEPALNVLAQIVEKLTKGTFTKNMLVLTVCIGVGTGMTVGATKILFGAGLIYFIIFKYAVALSLTAFINEDFVNIAWDSAGVTTGPVTVPFVLSVGVGCSKAVRASEGFGILACASVWPIISVLSVESFRRLVRWYRTTSLPHDKDKHIELVEV